MSRVTVTITGLLNDLNEGLKRENIAEKYGLPISDVREIFKHPKLVGKQARKAPGFILIDDSEEDVVQAAEPELDFTPSETPVNELSEPEAMPESQPEEEKPQATTDSLI